MVENPAHALTAGGPNGVSRRLGGTAGLVFLVLYFASSGMLLGPINQTDSLDKVQRTFADRTDNVDLACALLLLSAPFLLVFVTALRDALAAPVDRGLAALVVPAAAGAATLTLASAALMGGTSFLAEKSTVDGRTAAFAHSAAEALLFYGVVLFGTLALCVAASSADRLPSWYRVLATVLGVGMIAGSAGSPLVRGLALLAGLSSYLFFLVTGVVLLMRDRGPSEAPSE